MYMYQAALWCDDCGAKKRDELTAEGKAPACLSDEEGYDSDDFPKYVGEASDSEADSVSMCDGCEELLGESLTSEGERGLRESAEEQLTRKPEHVNVEYWRAVLADYGYASVLESVTLADLLRARLDSFKASAATK